MPFENSQHGTENQHPEHLSDKIGQGEATDKADMSDAALTPFDAEASGRTLDETETEHEGNPALGEPLESGQVHKSYYPEASVTKKIVVFGLATVSVLIALGLIYTFWR